MGLNTVSGRKSSSSSLLLFFVGGFGVFCWGGGCVGLWGVFCEDFLELGSGGIFFLFGVSFGASGGSGSISTIM